MTEKIRSGVGWRSRLRGPALRWTAATFLALTALATCAGCVQPPIRLLDDGAVHLEPDEGLLLLDVEAEVVFAALEIDDRLVGPIDRGPRLQLIRLRRGRYSIDSAFRGRYELRLGMVPGNEFDVLAGHISYPGTMIIELTRDERHFGARMLNRSAYALRRLEEQYPHLATTLPMRFTGDSRDDFLAEYRLAEKRLREGAMQE